jgi:hypothetical protein
MIVAIGGACARQPRGGRGAMGPRYGRPGMRMQPRLVGQRVECRGADARERSVAAGDVGGILAEASEAQHRIHAPQR